MTSATLYKSFLEGKKQNYADEINQEGQRQAEAAVLRTNQAKRVKDSSEYQKSVKLSQEKDRMRALATMQSGDIQSYYPQFSSPSKRISMDEEEETRSFNQRNNVHFMRAIASNATKAGDLKSARRYNQYAEEQERKQRETKVRAMAGTSNEISDDLLLLGTVRDQDTFDAAKTISNIRKRPLFQDEELMRMSNGGIYSKDVGSLLYGRMLDLRKARKDLGLDISVENDVKDFNEERETSNDKRIASKEESSRKAKLVDNLIEEGEKSKEKLEEEALGKLESGYRRKPDGSAEPIPGGSKDPSSSIPKTESEKRTAILSFEADNLANEIKDILKPSTDPTTGESTTFDPIDRKYIDDTILLQGPAAGAIAGGAVGAGAGMLTGAPVGAAVLGGVGAAVGGIVGVIAPSLADKKFKTYFDQMRGIVALTLYNKSGQALTAQEWETAKGYLIPWPGDSKQNKEYKLKNLQVAIDAFKAGKGQKIEMDIGKSQIVKDIVGKFQKRKTLNGISYVLMNGEWYEE